MSIEEKLIIAISSIGFLCFAFYLLIVYIFDKIEENLMQQSPVNYKLINFYRELTFIEQLKILLLKDYINKLYAKKKANSAQQLNAQMESPNTSNQHLYSNNYTATTSDNIHINNVNAYMPSKRTAQQELDWYWKKNKSKEELGRDYERYVGYCYEIDGYSVIYQGIHLGLHDEGIDLVCKKDSKILLVQCKRWGNEKTIYEKHIHQLYGTTETYKRLNKIPSDFEVYPVFVTTIKLSEKALETAETLGITVAENFSYTNDYPSIKCNLNNRGEKVYHMPCDPYYDITKVNKKGEAYVKTVLEAEALGFRRYSS